MKKRILLSGLILIMLAAVTPFAAAESIESDPPSNSLTMIIDGQPAAFSVPLININSNAYVSLREFSVAMGANTISWNSGTASVTAPGLTMEATVGNPYLVANGRYLYVPNSCRLINSSVMVPVRSIAEAFGAEVVWDGATNTVLVTSGSGAITPGNAYYDETDLLWMSRIISAEARGESFDGKIAVGGVIMNRVASPQFPNSIYGVIFDKRFGIQFSPAYSGAIYNRPDEECVIAAKIVLDGGNTAGNSLYFASTTHCWAAKTRPLALKIGNHNFYA